VELAALAKAKGLVTAVGLQARVNPALMYVKELIEAGFVGEVMAVHVSLMREGVLTRPSNRTWQRDAELGANTLTTATRSTPCASSPASSPGCPPWWQPRSSSGLTPAPTLCST
jgi:hypothetical protein